MAQKKDNKAIGNLVLCIIPLFGIIWAAVAGVQHSGYVKAARDAEIQFESKFSQLLSNLEVSKENNLVFEKLNITSMLPKFHETKLPSDPNPSAKSSYTLRISANPTISVDSKLQEVVDFELHYEFFINQEVYSDLIEYYSKDKITAIGTKEYVFETYYLNNPKSSPIYGLNKIFEKHYKNIQYFEYQDEVYVGASAQSIIELIEALPETLQANEEELKEFKALIDDIEGEYKQLNATLQADVTNYNDFVFAKGLYNAKSLQLKISKLPDVADYTLALGRTELPDLRSSYNKLSDEHKQLVENYDKLVEAELLHPIFKVKYYLDKHLDNQEKSQLESAVKFYNELSAEQKAIYKTTDKFGDSYYKLVVAVETYNSNNEKQLELK